MVKQSILGLSILLSGSLLAPSALAQPIIPDNTLGDEGSVVTPAGGRDLITGGATRGSSLFHSFDTFSINPGQAVYFENSPRIDNIFSRVTGRNVSNIEGILGVQGNANLFFLNPNGIEFGPGAQLDIGGSFVGTTAEQIDFGDGFHFSAAQPRPVPLLNINVTPGLQYGRLGSTSIISQVPLLVGQSLELRAGQLDLQGDVRAQGGVSLVSNSSINVSGEIDTSARLGQAGDIFIQADGDLSTGQLTASSTGNLSEIVFDALILAFFNGISIEEAISRSLPNLKVPGDGGDISIEANEILTIGNIESAGLRGGEIQLQSNQPLSISGKTIFSFTAGEQQGGQLMIDAPSLSITDFSKVATATIGNGSAGDVELQIPNELNIVSKGNSNFNFRNVMISSISPTNLIDFFLSNATGIGSVSAFKNGNSGDVSIITGMLTIFNNRARIDPNITLGLFSPNFGSDLSDLTGIASSTLFLSEANGGSINIEADTIRIEGNQAGQFRPEAIGPYSQDQIKAISILRTPTGITSVGQGTGRPGDISIQTRTLDIKNGAAITQGNLEGSLGFAERGLLSVDASEAIRLDGKAAIAAATLGKGNSDDIRLTVSETGAGIFLDNGAIIAADTLSVNPNAPASFQTGSAGDLVIQTPFLKLAGDSRIGAGSGVQGGQAGDLSITAGRAEIENSLISAETIEGAGGTLTLDIAESLLLKGQLRNGRPAEPGGLFAGGRGTGDGGKLTVLVPVLVVEDGAAVLASTQSGIGGDINVRDLDILTINSSGKISAETRTGQAGSLAINPDGSASQIIQITDPDSGLFANATDGGNAGSLFVRTQMLHLSNGAEMTVSSVKEGGAGDLTINPNVDGNLIIILADKSRISASISGSGQGGSINLSAPDDLTIQGDGIFSAETTGTGPGGNINLTAKNITIDQTTLQTRSAGTGIAGNITAENLNTLLMRNGSLILADAGGNADGGNISLGADFVIALPNDNTDIIANAVEGNGGRIDIEADAILNFDLNSEPNVATLRSNSANDISASSQSGNDGTLNLNGLNTDPTQGSAQLPSAPAPPSQIDRTCFTQATSSSNFTMTGRGGTPPSPTQALNTTTPFTTWIPLDLADGAVGFVESLSRIDEQLEQVASQDQHQAESAKPEEKLDKSQEGLISLSACHLVDRFPVVKN